MAVAIIRQTNRPGATVNLISSKTRKIIATTTADAKGIATFASVPPGEWIEQVIYTISDSGQNKTITETAGTPTDFAATQAAESGPILTDTNGSVWQITVTTGGTLGATKIAN